MRRRPLSARERERFARHLALPELGSEGQERLRGASALVVGLGGLGCPVCLYLAAAGIGRLGLADPDTVSLSNLQRQTLYVEASAGRPKVDEAAGRISAIDSSIEIELFPEGLTPGNARGLAGEFDIVMDCTDNWAARYLIDEACAGASTPWVFGSIGPWEGMAALMGGPEARRRLADLFPERAELEGRGPARGGVIGALPGVVGAAQASAAIQLIATGRSPLDGRLWTFDSRSFRSSLIEF